MEYIRGKKKKSYKNIQIKSDNENPQDMANISIDRSL